VFQLKQNGTWRTSNCAANKAYICKKSVNPLPKMNSVVNGICPKVDARNTIDQTIRSKMETK
jgi:hypothetical protein